MPDSPDLTPRQRDVAELVAQRLTTKRIAATLGISHRRVQAVVKRLALLAGATKDEDDRQAIAHWWRTSNPEPDTDRQDQQDAA